MNDPKPQQVRRDEPGHLLIRMPDGTDHGMSDEAADSLAREIRRVLWGDACGAGLSDFMIGALRRGVIRESDLTDSGRDLLAKYRQEHPNDTLAA